MARFDLPLLVLAAVFVLTVGAFAAPPPNADPGLASWFQSLQTKGGGSCCSAADCRTTEIRDGKDAYEVLIDERFGITPAKWEMVPVESLIQRYDNPTGKVVVCYSPYQGVLCVVRPSET